MESIVTDERYKFIQKIVGTTVKKGKDKLTTSDKIDKIVTNRILGIPIFIAVMFVVYYISVTTIGTIVTDWTNDTFVGGIQEIVGGFLEGIGTNDRSNKPCCGWCNRRCRRCPWFRTSDGNPVPVFVYPGRLRLHGSYCLCHGPGVPSFRSVR